MLFAFRGVLPRVRAVPRTEGVTDTGQLAAVILESDGTFSVIGKDRPGAERLSGTERRL